MDKRQESLRIVQFVNLYPVQSDGAQVANGAETNVKDYWHCL